MSTREALRALVADERAQSRLNERFLAAVEVHDELVRRWNPVHNLTRIESSQAARDHYADVLLGCLAVEDTLGAPRRVVDVGSGLGLPGLVAALLWPETAVHLVEAARKRVSFLERAQAAMKLRNVSVEHARVQDLQERWPRVMTRATFPWRELEPAFRVVEAGGDLAALVGDAPSEPDWREAAASWGASATRVVPYHVPGRRSRALLIASRPSI